MITLANLFLLGSLSAMPSVPAPVAADLFATAPQGRGGRGSGKGNPPPSGGTPEPATMLLLAGSAVGYGAYRLRRRKPDAVKDS